MGKHNPELVVKDKNSKKDKDKKKAKKSREKDVAAASEETEPAAPKEDQKVEAKAECWQPRQLFVSGIPYDATKDQLLGFFGEASKGSITEVKLPTF